MGDVDSEDTSLLQDAALSMTIHGLPHLFGPDPKPMKAFWLLVFLAAVGCSIWLIYLRVLDYEKHEVYIKTTTSLMQPMPFPAVTVCNSDRFSGAFFTVFSMRNMSCAGTTRNTRPGADPREVEFRKACKMFLSGYKDTLRFGGHDVAGFPNDFHSSDSFYPCFTFNKNGLASQMVNGAGKGLDMVLFNDPADVIPLARDNMSRFDDQRRGILIQIHDPETEASVDPSSSIAIAPGESVEVVISRKTFTRKKYPFPSNCHTSETTLYKSKRGRYTTSNCIFACFQAKLKRDCGDVLSANKSVTQIQCEAELYKQRPVGECLCPEPCYEVRYSQKISTNTWPKMFQLRSMKKEFSTLLNFTNITVTNSYIQKRFAKVKIYYQELISSASTEEELYGLGSLVSEIGGLMGLLIGASMISLAELLWLCGLSATSLVRLIFCPKDGLKGTAAGTSGNTLELGTVNRSDKLVGLSGHSYDELFESPSLKDIRRINGRRNEKRLSVV